MEKWKANLLGLGIAILAISFIYVLSYTLFPDTSLQYQSCSISSDIPHKSSPAFTPTQSGYLLDGKCINSEDYYQRSSEHRQQHNNQIFLTSLILSAVTLMIGISVRKVPVVGVALTWAGAVSVVVALSMGFDSFSSWVRTLVLGVALLAFILLAYYKLPDENHLSTKHTA